MGEDVKGEARYLLACGHCGDRKIDTIRKLAYWADDHRSNHDTPDWTLEPHDDQDDQEAPA